MSADAEFLGLRPDPSPGRYHLTVENHLARLDGRLYGGTAIAASITAAELVTERHTLWMTTRRVDGPTRRGHRHRRRRAGPRPPHQPGPGHRHQPRPRGDVRLLGATGNHRPRRPPRRLRELPRGLGARESGPFSSPFELMTRALGTRSPMPPVPEGVGFTTVVEFRRPEIPRHPDPGRASASAPAPRPRPVTPALAASSPTWSAVVAAGRAAVLGRGVSLDNSIRSARSRRPSGARRPAAPPRRGRLRPQHARLWSERRHLLGTAANQRPCPASTSPTSLGPALKRAAQRKRYAIGEVLDAGDEVGLGPLRVAGGLDRRRAPGCRRPEQGADLAAGELRRRGRSGRRRRSDRSLSASGRRTSKGIGSANTSSSRLADGYDSSTRPPAADRHAGRSRCPRWRSGGSGAPATVHRMISSAALTMSVGLVADRPQLLRVAEHRLHAAGQRVATSCRGRRWRR